MHLGALWCTLVVFSRDGARTRAVERAALPVYLSVVIADFILR